jgi:hypothetical protein
MIIPVAVESRTPSRSHPDRRNAIFPVVVTLRKAAAVKIQAGPFEVAEVGSVGGDVCRGAEIIGVFV